MLQVRVQPHNKHAQSLACMHTEYSASKKLPHNSLHGDTQVILWGV